MRPAPQTIKRQTRLDIFDGLCIRRLSWSGDLGDVQFRERIWDLSLLPSKDYRYSDASSDIYQHRVNNHDWDDDWIYGDDRFDLLGCSDELFAQFCTTMLHPAVRVDAVEANEIANILNDSLGHDGWQVVPDRRIGGIPIYRAEQRGTPREPAVIEPLLHEKVADPALFDEHLRRIRAGLKDDPPAAIGSAKELVETTCRVILDSDGVEHRPADDLLSLYKKVAAHLNLNAEAVPENAKGSKAAQSALRSLSATVQNLAEMRNALGTGHGRGARSQALARHARLAVTTAEALCRFLLDTWHERRGE